MVNTKRRSLGKYCTRLAVLCVLVLLVIASISGCTNNQDKISTVEARVRALEEARLELRDQISGIKKSIVELGDKCNDLEAGVTAVNTSNGGGEPLSIQITPLPPTGQGHNVTLTATTLPGAVCSIRVIYPSGDSKAAGLDEEKTADADGKVTWTWKVGTRTTPGFHDVKVKARLNGETETDTKKLEVLDTGSPG